MIVTYHTISHRIEFKCSIEMLIWVINPRLLQGNKWWTSAPSSFCSHAWSLIGTTLKLSTYVKHASSLDSFYCEIKRHHSWIQTSQSHKSYCKPHQLTTKSVPSALSLPSFIFRKFLSFLNKFGWAAILQTYTFIFSLSFFLLVKLCRE